MKSTSTQPPRGINARPGPLPRVPLDLDGEYVIFDGKGKVLRTCPDAESAIQETTRAREAEEEGEGVNRDSRSARPAAYDCAVGWCSSSGAPALAPGGTLDSPAHPPVQRSRRVFAPDGRMSRS